MSLAGHRLRHVYWLGGGSGGGKSTVARHLATRYGFGVYDTDAAMSDHARRSTPTDSPYLHEFMAMDMDQRWLLRSPDTMLETFHWFRGEGFDRIIDDLTDLPDDRPVIAEGFRLLPRLVAPVLTDPAHAVWLLPTPGFRETAFDRRGTTWQIAGRTSRPDAARRNLLERERLFTERLAVEVRELGLPAIVVDGTTTEADLTDRVATALG